MRRRYYRSRRVYPKPKWAICTNQMSFSVTAATATSFTVSSSTIISNPSRNDASGGSVNTASQILKAGRVKFKGVILTGMSAYQSALFSIMYIPEGINPSSVTTPLSSLGSSIFYTHPEWIMGWTRIDYTNAAQKNEVSITSRLKRNLNPGDKIMLIVYNFNNASSGSAQTIDITGTCSYCVRSN